MEGLVEREHQREACSPGLGTYSIELAGSRRQRFLADDAAQDELDLPDDGIG